MHNAIKQYIQDHTNDPKAYAEADVHRLVAEAHTRGDYTVSEAQIETFAQQARDICGQVLGGIQQRQDRASVFASEVHMNRYFKGWCLEGHIDLLERAPNNCLYLWDIKTGQRPPDVDQLVFYDVLARSVDVIVDTVGWLDRFGVFYEIPSDGSRRAKMRRRIRKVVEHVTDDRFAYTGFPEACTRCSCASSCPKLDENRRVARRNI